MTSWIVVLEVWPHASGTGAVKDQEAVGRRRRAFTVKADNIHQALEKADLIVVGITSHPMVWQAPIQSLNQRDG